MSIYRIAAGLVLAISALVSTADGQSRRVAPTPTPTPDDEVRVVTEEIKLNVLAFDAAGKFADGVSAADLVITENNILHQPTSVRRIPAAVLIVMDTGGEMRQAKGLEHTRRAAAAVVSALRPEDQVALMQYSDRAEIVEEWTSDKEALARAIGRTEFGRRSAFASALEKARELLQKTPADNKHLVLITDGTDSRGTPAAKAEQLRALLSTDITVHVLSYTAMEIAGIEPRTRRFTDQPPPKAMPDEVVAQLPPGVRDTAQAPKIGPTVVVDRGFLQRMRGRKADLERSEQQLSALAADTNGTFVLPDSPDEMIEKAALVAGMIDAAYVVTYTPKVPLSEEGGERTIFVTSKRPGLVVEARRRLVVGGN